MSKKIKKIIRRTILYAILSFFVVVLALPVTVWLLSASADMCEPEWRVDTATVALVRHDGFEECGGSLFRRSESGLWEMYVEGVPAKRGADIGRMSDSLLYYQEKVFVDQIRTIIPSDGYLKLLRRLLIAFNRNLGRNVPLEYREEIYGISQFCTHEFDAIGSPYERQLNYHAAHDVGHTMQDYMLVGCSSFGAWGGASADSALIIGRNFDFWVGDDFAHNKLVSFFAPDNGYRFASIGWPGMIGVLSGMNEKGLTVTINAAKGVLPTSAATPISILAREILQYASTIEEAMDIARRRQTFVSESILIGSAADGRAAIIEKSPKEIALFESDGDVIVCTNHYQSGLFADDERNVENILTSDSPYRFERLQELIGWHKPLEVHTAAAILRDRYGLGGRDIGLTNEKSINQSIAHHAVIFKPEKLQMWVSVGPWQSGRFVCYDLVRIFAGPDFSDEIYAAELSLPADSLFIVADYPRVVEHRCLSETVRKAVSSKKAVGPGVIDAYIANNPQLYYVYKLAADYALSQGDKDAARQYLQAGLTKEIPKQAEREQMEKQLNKLNR